LCVPGWFGKKEKKKKGGKKKHEKDTRKNTLDGEEEEGEDAELSLAQKEFLYSTIGYEEGDTLPTDMPKVCLAHCVL